MALGVPLYQQIEQIRKQALPILACQLAGCIVGAASAFLIAQYCGATLDVAISLAPKSATTPIAMEVSKAPTGGIPYPDSHYRYRDRYSGRYSRSQDFCGSLA